MVGNAVVMNLGDVRAEATAIVENARREAAEIVAAAEAKAASLVEGAAERGHAEGYARGEEAGHTAGHAAGTEVGRTAAEDAMSSQLQELADGWSTALDSIVQARELLHEEARRDLVRLSMAIAERVLGTLPAHDPTLVIGQVEAAVEMLAGATRLRIRIHPEDRPLVETHFADATSRIGSSQDTDLLLETDETIIRGGCVVSAGDGQVDARIDAQVSRIVKGLFPELLEVPPAATEERPGEPS